MYRQWRQWKLAGAGRYMYGGASGLATRAVAMNAVQGVGNNFTDLDPGESKFIGQGVGLAAGLAGAYHGANINPTHTFTQSAKNLGAVRIVPAAVLGMSAPVIYSKWKKSRDKSRQEGDVPPITDDPRSGSDV